MSAQRQLRRAVAGVLDELSVRQPLVVVACSGGADSLALAAATAQVVRSARFAQYGAGAVVVDHGLQQDSAQVAARAAEQCLALGLDPVLVRRSVPAANSRSGPEAAAREARYGALEAAAGEVQAAAVLLGHTADDQAETVLLGLARGSGPRALAGMPATRGMFRRPLLDLPREVVRSAYPELESWVDPHNEDPRFTRSRVRHRVLPVLERELGPGVAAALARSAAQVRAEVEAVDFWADQLAAACVESAPDGTVAVDAKALVDTPAAVVTRVMRTAAVLAGANGSLLTSVHLGALTALVSHWRGQGPAYLPGHVIARRLSGTVVLGSGTSRDLSTTPNQ